MADINGVKKHLETLKKQIKEKEDVLAKLNVWEEQMEENAEKLQQLIHEVGTLAQAQELLAQKEEIIAAAKQEAQSIADEVAQKQAEINEAQQWLEVLQEELGIYEDAATVRKEAEAYAQKCQADAETAVATQIAQVTKEYDTLLIEAEVEKANIVQEAQKRAKEIVAKGEADYREMLKSKDNMLQEAQNSADNIIQEAREEVERYYACKEAEGEQRKKNIIEMATLEKNDILAHAHTEKEKLLARAKATSDDMLGRAQQEKDSTLSRVEADRAHMLTRAEQEKERILSGAHKEADRIYEAIENARKIAQEKADAIYEQARQKAEKIQEAACMAAANQRTDLEKREKEIAKLRGEYEGNLAALNREKTRLERFEDMLEHEVEERVAQKYSTLQHELKEAQDSVRRVYRNAKENTTAKSIERNTKLESDLAQFDAKTEKIAELEKRLKEDKAKYEELENTCTKRTNDYDTLKVAQLANATFAGELGAEKDKNKYYQDTIQELLGELDKNKAISRESMIAPMKTAPAFMLEQSLKSDSAVGTEIEWLEHIQRNCENTGLHFSKRQLYAFHTAQIIKDMSPLVVLAGVSGTGKSELPKNYAIHGGMNFLSIPVKPDWDSPASLFGYFNSIERRFEATELVRALYQMSNGDHQNQMMMVLLDEMNLAHPEQYFADLLSKLETSRGLAQSAQYDILLGGGEKPEPLSIGSNILWTGTMNEDETTKGLSDKVIDRSSLITFPRPRKLYDRKDGVPIASTFVLQKRTWDSWCATKPNESQKFADQMNEYKNVVQNLNEEMSQMGRNLGHRVWQGIARYMSHHPEVKYNKSDKELTDALHRAFADALVFKVMPKLRGVETRGQNEVALDAIEKILGEHANEISGDFRNACSLTTELFQWCSADFMNQDD